MKAAWYEKQGPPREVLVVGEMSDPIPAAGEVRIRIAASGINPGDIKKRQNAFGYGMAYPRVIPHSDGAGRVAPSRAQGQQPIDRREHLAHRVSPRVTGPSGPVMLSAVGQAGRIRMPVMKWMRRVTPARKENVTIGS